MLIASLLNPKCVRVPLKASCPTDAVCELVDLATAQGLVRYPDDVKAAVFQRERNRHTVAYEGFALPRCTSPAVVTPFIAIGMFEERVRWCAECPFKVSLVILYCAHDMEHGVYIRRLVDIAKVIQYEECRDAMLEAKTPQELVGVVEAIWSD